MFGKQGVVLVEEPPAHDWFTYTTADGGLTWSNPHVLPVQAPQQARQDIPWQAALDPENWWMVDAQGLLYRTDDGGSTWHSSRPTLPAGYTLEYVKPVGAGVLWGIAIASGDNFPVRSTDGGATWSAIKLPGG